MPAPSRLVGTALGLAEALGVGRTVSGARVGVVVGTARVGSTDGLPEPLVSTQARTRPDRTTSVASAAAAFRLRWIHSMVCQRRRRQRVRRFGLNAPESPVTRPDD